MPKVVVYVRADDARIIEAGENRDIDEWVRMVVREQIIRWHSRRFLKGAQVIEMPRRQDDPEQAS